MTDIAPPIEPATLTTMPPNGPAQAGTQAASANEERQRWIIPGRIEPTPETVAMWMEIYVAKGMGGDWRKTVAELSDRIRRVTFFGKEIKGHGKR